VASPGTPPSELEYWTALIFALETSTDPGLFLKGLFGDDLKFIVDKDKGKVLLNLTGGDDAAHKILATVAEPSQFGTGRFIYPPRMDALLQLRQRVADRLADYHAAVDLSAIERMAVIGAVARAERLQPEKTLSAQQLQQ